MRITLLRALRRGSAHQKQRPPLAMIRCLITRRTPDRLVSHALEKIRDDHFSVLRCRKTRVTCGSKVRRSLFDIFLIDEGSFTYAGINITENITQVERSNEPNPLNIGSPTKGSNLGPAD